MPNVHWILDHKIELPRKVLHFRAEMIDAMKGFLLFILLYSSGLIAQCEYGINSVDEFTKVKTVATMLDRVGIFTIGKPQLLMAIYYREKDDLAGYYLRVDLDNMKEHECFSTGSKLYILSTDTEVIELSYDGDVVCGDYNFSKSYDLHGYFLIFPDDLKKLSTKNIDKVRVVTSDHSHDIEMRTNNNGFGVQWFKRVVPCILNRN